MEIVIDFFPLCHPVVEQEVFFDNLMDEGALYPQMEDAQFGAAIVHELVHQVQQAVSVALDVLQLLVYPAVADFVHQLLQRGENQGEWCAQFVRDVDEEA